MRLIEEAHKAPAKEEESFATGRFGTDKEERLETGYSLAAYYTKKESGNPPKIINLNHRLKGFFDT
jgi:hypothetical protein